MTRKGKQWLKSPEVRKQLKISTCDLAHFRVSGKLRARKEGNAYLYSADDCTRLCKQKAR